MAMRLIERAAILIKREILRDPFLLEIKRWFRDDGDSTLRLDYPLDEHSVVCDLGGYHGDFAAQIHQRYACNVFVFEPVPVFHEHCVARFSGNADIHCLNFGLSDKAGWFEIDCCEDASSFVRSGKRAISQRAELRPVTAIFEELGIRCVDLLKINIEGGEYDVLESLIKSHLMERIRFVQVQFHHFVPDAEARRQAIRSELAKSHVEMWNYPFVWESWAVRQEQPS